MRCAPNPYGNIGVLVHHSDPTKLPLGNLRDVRSVASAKRREKTPTGVNITQAKYIEKKENNYHGHKWIWKLSGLVWELTGRGNCPE